MSTSFRWPNNILLVNHTNNVLTQNILYPFAFDEVACRKVGFGQTPMIHMWRHMKAFVLGMRDWKLPKAKEGVAWLQQQGYDVMVRHSGGAAVPVDKGVINISIILPKPIGEINIHHDFEIMYQFIKNTLGGFSREINKGEVIGSYCPGDYDLSINGFKFCGIAQRRQTKSFIVHAFVVVEGSGSDRAALVRDFYKIAVGNSDEFIEHPQVEPTSTASLSELTNLNSVDHFVDQMKKYISTEANIFEQKFESNNIEIDNDEILDMMERIKSRYREE
ncbi:lipoate--protein ligase family protein [Chengkuizengella sediminis]|uniref:lipoate--protein ligase family protein n=1 Tax=Chengkuizengella sediminis TaxID=1885917 RepID=UPI001389A5CD|nr:lipoate--protein ligase family protein [Chengkuizengella sediminis]NDI34842.1 lipoate--protein ligase family protein [Chengkuizengella sediminis]